jgi:hypothetical protein
MVAKEREEVLEAGRPGFEGKSMWYSNPGHMMSRFSFTSIYTGTRMGWCRLARKQLVAVVWAKVALEMEEIDHNTFKK